MSACACWRSPGFCLLRDSLQRILGPLLDLLLHRALHESGNAKFNVPRDADSGLGTCHGLQGGEPRSYDWSFGHLHLDRSRGVQYDGLAAFVIEVTHHDFSFSDVTPPAQILDGIQALIVLGFVVDIGDYLPNPIDTCSYFATLGYGHHFFASLGFPLTSGPRRLSCRSSSHGICSRTGTSRAQ